jgi:plasmid maintenance system antidote protein VapI
VSKAKKPAALSDQLRAAIVGSGLSVYALAKGSGVSHPVILRFVSKERGLHLETADKLAAFLGLELCKTGE